MSRPWMITLIVLAVLVIAVLILILFVPRMVFNFLFGRPERSKKIPDFYIGTPHYNASQAGLAIMKQLPNEDLFLTSRDGLKLHAYLFPAENPGNRFVIGVHGYRSYSRPECAPYIEFYRSMGFNMLMVDDRAHAPSEGEHIGFGVLDRMDVVDWAKLLVENYGEDCQILLHGVSMGAATVLAASGEEDLPRQVMGIISDCGFTSPGDILRYQLGDVAHLPADWILSRVEKIWNREMGCALNGYAAVDQVKKSVTPILFVHGEKDTMVPVPMVYELFDACASEKRLLVVPEAGHGESIAFAPEEYHRAILEHFHLP